MPSRIRLGAEDDLSFLEREALFASGVAGEEGIRDYGEKLDRLLDQTAADPQFPEDRVKRSAAVFKHLWMGKAHRYKSGGLFRLHEVIDAQLDQSGQSVGNCLGLTLLYNCLLKRLGIPVSALYLEKAFGLRPHVLSFLSNQGDGIDIENIFPHGFDFRGHWDNPARTHWGDRDLVADIHFSIGNEYLEKGDLRGALKNYDRALDWNPEYEKAYCNRAIAASKQKREGTFS